MTGWAISQTRWTSLHARVRRLTRRADSEDLLQATLLRLLERDPSVIAAGDAYVIRAARNLAIDEHRRERRARLASLPDREIDALPCAAPLPDAVILGREQVALVEAAFSRLDRRTARIFLLHRLESLPYRMIAQTLGVSISTVEKEISKALFVLTVALLDGDAP